MIVKVCFKRPLVQKFKSKSNYVCAVQVNFPHPKHNLHMRVYTLFDLNFQLLIHLNLQHTLMISFSPHWTKIHAQIIKKIVIKGLMS